VDQDTVGGRKHISRGHEASSTVNANTNSFISLKFNHYKLFSYKHLFYACMSNFSLFLVV